MRGPNTITGWRCDGKGFTFFENVYASDIHSTKVADSVAGRCRLCKVAFRWPKAAKFRLMEAHCPICGEKLSQTIVHLLKKGYRMDIDKPLGPGAGERLREGGTP